MLKVMIVDDEIIVRVGLQSCIRWEDWGCQVVAACQSGKEAIDFMEKDLPDIVFTDIMMPEMDGVELVKYTKDNYPKTKVVVLSCMNEIEYVKKAIKYGAEDYILKLSFTPETLTELLSKLREDIEKERLLAGSEGAQPEMKLFQRSDLFCKMLQTDSDEERAALLDQLGIPEGDSFLVLCLLIDRFKTRYGGGRPDVYVMKNGLLNLAKEYLGMLGEDIFFQEENELMVVFRCTASRKETEKRVGESFLLLNEALKVHLNLTVSGGIAWVNGRLRLSEGSRLAQELARLRFFTGGGQFHNGEECLQEDFVTRRSMQRKLQEAIFMQDGEESRRLLDEWFDRMQSCRSRGADSRIKRSVVETWIFISGYSLPEESGFKEIDDSGVTVRIWEAETLAELREVMNEALEAILSWLAASKSISNEIRDFLVYLEGHVAENFTLVEAAAKCALGRSQFCILFKKATGETFINYLNRKKMEKAFQALSSENILVQDAAYRVGITDISYFNKLFKKYYDLSPSEVKKPKKEIVQNT